MIWGAPLGNKKLGGDFVKKPRPILFYNYQQYGSLLQTSLVSCSDFDFFAFFDNDFNAGALLLCSFTVVDSNVASVFFSAVPDDDLVLTSWDVLKFERTVCGCDCVVRMRHHNNPA